VHIGASANLQVVDKFCYLGDMLSVDGDADAAVQARIQIGRNKFRQLVQLQLQLEMWANAQRDGTPAEHRWRPLFNAAKFG